MFGVLSIMATLAMFGLFIFSSNRIHEMVLDKEMEQNEEALCRCADKINRVLVKNYEKAGKRVQISSSIGIVKTDQGTVFSDLYEKADLALYKVKRQGRNGYKIWNE